MSRVVAFDVPDSKDCPQSEVNTGGRFARLMAFVYSSDDTSEERLRKNVAFVPAVFLVVNQFAFAVVRMLQGKWFWFTINFVRFLMGVFVASYILVTKRVPLRFLEGFLMLGGFLFCILGDFFSFGLEDLWSVAVLVMDCLLLTNARPAAATATCAFATLYLIVKTTEEGIGLGLYDLVPQDWVPGLEPRDKAGVNWTVTVLFIRVCVLLLDFYMTRRFAYKMREEQAKSESAVQLAERIADALVRFDLETASALVGDSDDELSAQFRKLLSNLRAYRPYLPNAVFATTGPMWEDTSDQKLSLRETPPACIDHVTIVFTDIQSSTELWETRGQAMKDALRAHNGLIRMAVYLSDGYEVKTIGDAFMVAFDTARDALLFSVRVQESLLQHTWPAALLTHPLCKHVDGWNGLRVRIGVHTGLPRFEVNPVTNRGDYIGPMVNKAARVEGASVGGAIMVTKEVIDALEAADRRELGECEFLNVGHWNLRGVGETVLYLVLPASLEARRSEVTDVLRNRGTGTTQRRGTIVTSSGQPPSYVRYQVPRSSLGALQGQRLQRSRGTLVALQFDLGPLLAATHVAPPLDKLFALVVNAAERTEGLLGTFYSGTAVIEWNTSQQCPSHVRHSLDFVTNLRGALEGTMWEDHLWCGVGSGHVVHGTLGERQRVFTVVSDVVELAVSLAEGARVLRTECLLAGLGVLSAAEDPSLRQHTRPVDVWGGGPPEYDPQHQGQPLEQPQNRPQRTRTQSSDWAGRRQMDSTKVTIYEFNTVSFAETPTKWKLADSGTVVAEQWGRRYKELFETRDVVGLEALCDEDPVLVRIAQLMGGELYLPRPSYCGMRVGENSPPAAWLEHAG